jgi:hypothetical protein
MNQINRSEVKKKIFTKKNQYLPLDNFEFTFSSFNLKLVTEKNTNNWAQKIPIDGGESSIIIEKRSVDNELF